MAMYLQQSVELLIQLSVVIMAGLYFTFSNTVMAALAKFESGADVMVEINQVILNPVFMVVFWGSGLGSLYWIIVAEGPLFFSGLTFFVGTTVVTMAKNVPLNNQLKDAGLEREGVWRRYLERWVFWNHLRTLAGIASTLLLLG